jgi:hypothetical protein
MSEKLETPHVQTISSPAATGHSLDSPAVRDKRHLDTALAHVRDALVGLQFGEVLVVIQDGVVVQVERTERKRIRKHDR